MQLDYWWCFFFKIDQVYFCYFVYIIPNTTTSDFERISITDFIHYFLSCLNSWESASISLQMLSAKQGNDWYPFYKVFGLTSLNIYYNGVNMREYIKAKGPGFHCWWIKKLIEPFLHSPPQMVLYKIINNSVACTKNQVTSSNITLWITFLPPKNSLCFPEIWFIIVQRKLGY